MDEAGPRYALYFAPDPASDLWRFGSACLGYDAATGVAVPALPVPGFAPDVWSALTDEPRRYGFHATLKAPFHLAIGFTEAQVMDAVDAFASSHEAFTLPRLQISLLSRFIALVPAAQSAQLQDLAARAVEALEPLRAPLSAADVERRLRAPLSETQQAHVQRWGYPYVFEEFRFHMTLTGALDASLQARVFAELSALYRANVSEQQLRIDSVALFCQERRDAPFKIIRRAPLRPQRPA
jgi:putative phosphonate metabolism protein